MLAVLIAMATIVPPDSGAAVQNPAERTVNAQKENEPKREGQVLRVDNEDKERGNQSRYNGHENAHRPIYDVAEEVVFKIEYVFETECPSECERLG